LDGAGNTGSNGKAPAKTKNCCFRLLNVLFSDEISPKFLTIGAKKDKNLLDTGLAANDLYFWQEVAEKYQDVNDDYECLAWNDPLFDDIDASVALPHSWSKLHEIYKGLSKLYSEVFENHKKSGSHDKDGPLHYHETICHFNSNAKQGQKEIEIITFCKVALWTQIRCDHVFCQGVCTITCNKKNQVAVCQAKGEEMSYEWPLHHLFFQEQPYKKKGNDNQHHT